MSEEQQEQAESENRQEPGSWVTTIGDRQVALRIPDQQAAARAMAALMGLLDVLGNPEDADTGEIETALKNLNNLLELFVSPLFLRPADRRAVDAMMYTGTVGAGDVIMIVAQGATGNREQRREAARVTQKPKRHGGGGRGGKRNR
jgi:hypothetical protein